MQQLPSSLRILTNLSTEQTLQVVSGSQVPLLREKRPCLNSHVPTTPVPVCYVTAKDRHTSRSLNHIASIEDLETPSDNTAEDLLLL